MSGVANVSGFYTSEVHSLSPLVLMPTCTHFPILLAHKMFLFTRTSFATIFFFSCPKAQFTMIRLDHFSTNVFVYLMPFLTRVLMAVKN